MKRGLSLFLSVVLLLSLSVLSGCGRAAVQNPDPGKFREFTDDCGRTVTLPETISRVAVSGPLAQIYCIPICLDLFVGFSSDFSVEAEKYFPPEVVSLPTVGQLYGGKGTMELEELLSLAPDVVIDVGEAKGSIAEDLDQLSSQTGIPFVHINSTMETSADTFRRLGELTGRAEKAEELARWCEETLASVNDTMQRVDADGARVRMVYCLGDKGLNVLAKGSFHAGVINLVSENAAVIEEVSNSGDGNEIDLEQMILWNPEVLIFAPDSIYESVRSEDAWQQLDAVKNGNVFASPYGPYGWLQSPPAVQGYLGLIWLTALFYPDTCTYDLQEKVTEYYRLFYGYDLSDSDYDRLTQNALN